MIQSRFSDYTVTVIAPVVSNNRQSSYVMFIESTQSYYYGVTYI